MGTKLIYFVRHGESDFNAKGIGQGQNEPLNERGKKQVMQTADRFPKETGKPQIIIASPYQRTRETAEIIANVLNISIEYSDLLVEKEENFVDLKERAKALLSFISGRPEQRIIMVTHSNFLKMAISYMLHEEKLTLPKYNELSDFNTINNAGIAICAYIPHYFKKDEWKVITWNDTGINN